MRVWGLLCAMSPLSLSHTSHLVFRFPALALACLLFSVVLLLLLLPCSHPSRNAPTRPTSAFEPRCVVGNRQEAIRVCGATCRVVDLHVWSQRAETIEEACNSSVHLVRLVSPMMAADDASHETSAPCRSLASNLSMPHTRGGKLHQKTALTAHVSRVGTQKPTSHPQHLSRSLKCTCFSFCCCLFVSAAPTSSAKGSISLTRPHTPHFSRFTVRFRLNGFELHTLSSTAHHSLFTATTNTSRASRKPPQHLPCLFFRSPVEGPYEPVRASNAPARTRATCPLSTHFSHPPPAL